MGNAESSHTQKNGSTQTSAPKWASKLCWLLITATILILGGLAAMSPKPQSRLQQSESQHAESVEFMLACIAANGTVDKDCTEVQEFRRIVDSIQKNSGCSREQVGDIIVHSQKVLRSKGKDYPLLKLANGLEVAVRQDRTGQSLNDIAAKYTYTILILNSEHR